MGRASAKKLGLSGSSAGDLSARARRPVPASPRAAQAPASICPRRAGPDAAEPARGGRRRRSTRMARTSTPIRSAAAVRRLHAPSISSRNVRDLERSATCSTRTCCRHGAPTAPHDASLGNVIACSTESWTVAAPAMAERCRRAAQRAVGVRHRARAGRERSGTARTRPREEKPARTGALSDCGVGALSGRFDTVFAMCPQDGERNPDWPCTACRRSELSEGEAVRLDLRREGALSILFGERARPAWSTGSHWCPRPCRNFSGSKSAPVALPTSCRGPWHRLRQPAADYALHRPASRYAGEAWHQAFRAARPAPNGTGPGCRRSRSSRMLPRDA